MSKSERGSLGKLVAGWAVVVLALMWASVNVIGPLVAWPLMALRRKLREWGK